MDKKTIQVNQSINRIIYGALLELMLDSYGNTSIIKDFNHSLKVKHTNILTDWKRESKVIFDFLQKSGNEEVILQYHQVVNVIEGIMKIKDLDKFKEVLDFVEKRVKVE
jgi:hypothetical protein